MQEIDRVITDRIYKKIAPNKVIVILGARRVGKTFLIHKMKKKLEEKEKCLLLNGEDFITEELLTNKSLEQYRSLLGNNKFLIIDEAQKIQQIGRILKLMIDELEGLKIIVTGSSAFGLSNKVGEPLTGRKFTFMLFPVAQCELIRQENLFQTRSNQEERLIYGSYPEIFKYTGLEDKIDYLGELVNAYLFRDILALDNIKNSSKLINILRLLAFQIGMKVSINEIANQIGLNKGTIEKYLDLLTKVFVIFKVEGFSRNLRKEISKTSRYYFWDNGIRNYLVSNFNTLSIRNDIGQLWENYIISERMKYQNYYRMVVNNYFWRTYDRQEIDWVEEREGGIYAYEIKYKKDKVKIPGGWKTAYPEAGFEVINRDNYLDFIT